MFRFARSTIRLTPRTRRIFAASSAGALGVAVTTTAVAFAASPYTVTDKEVVTVVPSLTPADLSEPTSFEQAKKEAEEAEAAQQKNSQRQAYNPETGEIDWDCPCLGGMAHGPCGEEFKEAFACFVYSKSEIRGSECIPKFSEMQACFRKYPEVYAEFNDDTETVAEAERGTKETAVKENVAETAQEAKQAATEAENELSHKAAEKLDEAKHTAHEAAQTTKEAVSDAKQTVKETVGEKPVTSAVEGTRAMGADAAATVSEYASSASEIASSKTSEYKRVLHEAGIDSADAVSEYASRAQTAADEVVANIKQSAEKLSNAQVADLVEAKLNEAHEVVSGAFSNTEKNQSPFRQTQKFATGAVAGITAEAKEAVNYVSTQLSGSGSGPGSK